jgi:hypothetical protein
MRYLAALAVLVIACGGPKAKKETLVNDDTPSNCCCKTVPTTAEKEITPVYAQQNRMECSTNQGECVADVQCNGSQPSSESGGSAPPVQPMTNDNGPAVP